MAEGTDRPAGERRRRREAERAAALAAEAAGGEIAGPQTGAGEIAGPQTGAGEIAVESPDRSASLRSGGSPAISAGGAPSGTPSRRSLRDRATEGADDATATSGRPVIRTPSTAQAVRSLDAAGQLTGIQPVVRPDVSDHPHPAGRHTSYLDGPARAARAALPLPIVPSQTPGRDHAAEKRDVPQPPEWLAVGTPPGATAADAQSKQPAHRSERAEVVPQPETPPRPGSRVVTAVKVVAIVLLAGVIGALLWLLGSEVFADDPAGASASATIITITPTPEESSAR